MVVNAVLEYRGHKKRVSKATGNIYYLVNFEDECGEAYALYLADNQPLEVTRSQLTKGTSYLVQIDLTDYQGNTRTGIYDIQPLPFDAETGEVAV